MILELALFSQMATMCAPGQDGRRLASVASVESQFNTLAILDNSTSRSYSPASREEAERLASSLIADGRSVDLGLMQINSRNLPKLRLSIPDVFDACHSIAAASFILREDDERASRMALSFYNTGDAFAGTANGYSTKVETAFRKLFGSDAVAAPAPLAEPPSCAPTWDVWATAACSGEPTPQLSRGVTAVSLKSPENNAHAE